MITVLWPKYTEWLFLVPLTNHKKFPSPLACLSPSSPVVSSGFSHIWSVTISHPLSRNKRLILRGNINNSLWGHNHLGRHITTPLSVNRINFTNLKFILKNRKDTCSPTTNCHQTSWNLYFYYFYSFVRIHWYQMYWVICCFKRREIIITWKKEQIMINDYIYTSVLIMIMQFLKYIHFVQW